MAVLDHCNKIIAIVVAVVPLEFSLLLHAKFISICHKILPRSRAELQVSVVSRPPSIFEERWISELHRMSRVVEFIFTWTIAHPSKWWALLLIASRIALATVSEHSSFGIMLLVMRISWSNKHPPSFSFYSVRVLPLAQHQYLSCCKIDIILNPAKITHKNPSQPDRICGFQT